MYGDILEHRHRGWYYWHPATRVHPNAIKEQLPEGHIKYKNLILGCISSTVIVSDDFWKYINFDLFADNFIRLLKEEVIKPSDIFGNQDYINYLIFYSLINTVDEITDIPKRVRDNISNYINDKLMICLLKKEKYGKSLDVRRITEATGDKIEEIQEEEAKKFFVSIPELENINYDVDETTPLYSRMSSIVRSWYESFYDESSLCLYYTYYVLNLKGNKDFDLEFRTLENKLYNDFYYYGLYSTIRELRHLIDKLYFELRDKQGTTETISIFISFRTRFGEGKKEPELKISSVIKEKIEYLVNHCLVDLQIDEKIIYKLIKIYLMYIYINNKTHWLQENYKEKNYKEGVIKRDINFCYLVEKYFGYFTRPDIVLKMARDLFKVGEDGTGKCYWGESYGGIAWSQVAELMLERKEMISKTVFVDTCWSLQHNTELFINKVYDPGQSIAVLDRYLGDIKDGKFNKVYRCAIKYNRKLDRYVYKSLVVEMVDRQKIEEIVNKVINEEYKGFYTKEYVEEYIIPYLDKDKLKELLINKFVELYEFDEFDEFDDEYISDDELTKIALKSYLKESIENRVYIVLIDYIRYIEQGIWNLLRKI